MSATAPDLRERVGPYRLIRAIGAGGSARIDLARIERAYGFQRHVVVKRPLEHLRGDPQVSASLRREARIGGRLRHPNLVAVLDAGEHDGYDYLVLEYIHGASLRTLMQTEAGGTVREVPLAVALGIAIDVARGLHDAHQLTDERGKPLGLVHRDVSPGNVLLGLDGAVKLADFGIAKETRVATLSGSMHGTVTYMAPEQCRGHAFDRRADIFSIGVILYELVTQTRLFWADNDVASLHRVLSGQVTRPRKLKPALSPTLEELVMTAIDQDPERRFANARMLADGLEGLAASEGHVVGARWVARTVEEVVGVKHAPWIAATTEVDAPKRREVSLVAVIESIAADATDSVESTFGPVDERALKEGSVPSVPTIPDPTVPARSSRRRILPFALGGVVVGTGLAFGLLFRPGGNSTSAVKQPDVPKPDVQKPDVQKPDVPKPDVPKPDVQKPDVPKPDVPKPDVPKPDVPKPDVQKSQAPRPHHHNRPPTAPTVGAGSGSSSVEVPPTVEPPPPAGSAAKPPANVEWKPTMLLPTDSGSGHAK